MNHHTSASALVACYARFRFNRFCPKQTSSLSRFGIIQTCALHILAASPLRTATNLELDQIPNIAVDDFFDVPLDHERGRTHKYFEFAMLDEQDQRNRSATIRQSTVKAPRTISSRDLLGTDKMVIIRHDRQDYRLQVTAAGKLILTK